MDSLSNGNQSVCDSSVTATVAYHPHNRQRRLSAFYHLLQVQYIGNIVENDISHTDPLQIHYHNVNLFGIYPRISP